MINHVANKEQGDMVYNLFNTCCEGCKSWGCVLIRKYIDGESELEIYKQCIRGCPCIECIVKVVCGKYCDQWHLYVKECYPDEYKFLAFTV